MDRQAISFVTFLSTTPTIKELAEHVDVSTNWYIVGTMLDLDQRRLRSIEGQTGHTDTYKMIEMFNLWLDTTPTASRRQVLEALRISVVGENTLADEYEKYLKEIHEATYIPPSTKAVLILQRNIQSLNEALVSPVQVSQLLYCKRCISEATLDEMERIDQSRSLDDKKTTLLTAMQETVSSDYRKLKDIATVLSDVEETRDMANEMMTKYEEKIPPEDDGTVQPQEVVGGNEDRASDILRNNYSALSQSITEPVRVAKLLHEEVISDEALSCVMSTKGSVSDSRAVLLKAVRDAVHSNYKHLEVFVTVLRKFSETAHIGDTIFEEYIADLRIPFPHDMKFKFQEMRVKFGSTFYRVRCLFSEKLANSQNVDKVKEFLADCFPDLKSELSVAKTIDDVLEVVKRKCSIVDVHPLEVIAVHFKVKEAEDIIREHKEAAKIFCESVSVSLSSNETLQAISTQYLLCKTITFFLDWNPDKITLQDINDVLLKLELLHKYSIKLTSEATEKINQITVNDCEAANEELEQLLAEEKEKVNTLGQETIELNDKLKVYQTISRTKDREIEDLRARLEKKGQDTTLFKKLSESQLQKIKKLKFEVEDSHKIIDSGVESLQEKLVKTNEELKLLKKLHLSDKTMGKLQTLSEIEDLQEENKQLKAAVIQKEEELIAAKKELASFKELAESRNQEIKELKQEHENLWKAKEESFAKEAVLNEQASQMKEELSSLNNELKESGESNEELKKELQAVRKMSRAKDAEIEMLKKENKVNEDVQMNAEPLSYSTEPLSITEAMEKETALNQQKLELSKKFENDTRSKFKAPSTAGIGFMYATFILLLVAICWQPDPRTFISSLPGVEVIASHKFLVAGGQSSQLHWEEFGLKLDIPSDALPHGFVAEVVIRVSVSGPYVYPDPKTWKPASAVYWISSSKKFVNPVLLGIWHNVKGSANSSSIKVLTAEDTPQNMSYIFNEFMGDFTVKGSYVYFKLAGFSGKKVVTSFDVRNFQGALFYKMSEVGKKWFYSLVIYNSHTNGVKKSLFDGTKYEDWIQDLEEFDVIFEENSESLELNITFDPPLENWIIQGRINPLSYRKDALQSQERIVSNMQFDLYWNGSSDILIDTYLMFPLKGAENPKAISANPSTINHKSADAKFTEKTKDMKLDINDLDNIDSKLKDSNFDCSKWSGLGLKLGLSQITLNTIEDDYQNTEARLKKTLEKWLYQVDKVDKNGGATWKALGNALEKIDQKAVAEKIKD